MDKESRDYREHSYPELLASLPSHQAEPLAAYVEAVCEERDRNHREYREQAALVSLWEKRATDGVKAREAVEAERDRLKRLIEGSPIIEYKRPPELKVTLGISEPSEWVKEVVYAVPVAALEQKP